MSQEIFRPKIEFVGLSEDDPLVIARMEEVAGLLRAQGKEVNPLVVEDFEDPSFFNSLPEEIRSSNERLMEYLDNSQKFANIIDEEREKRFGGDMSGLFGDTISAPETSHADGRERMAEKNYIVNVDYLRTKNIDPSKVLFFRLTQPSDVPKPEYYWTSNLSEVQKGLRVEVPKALRETAIILVSDMETISRNGGLLQDINDDSGLAVRQIGVEGFDQTKVITKFKPARSK